MALVMVRVDDSPSGVPIWHELAVLQIGESRETPVGSVMSVTHAGTRTVPILPSESGP